MESFYRCRWEFGRTSTGNRSLADQLDPEVVPRINKSICITRRKRLLVLATILPRRLQLTPHTRARLPMPALARPCSGYLHGRIHCADVSFLSILHLIETKDLRCTHVFVPGVAELYNLIIRGRKR